MNFKKLKNFIPNSSTTTFTYSTLNLSFMPPNFNLISPLQSSPMNLHVERIGKKKSPYLSSPLSTSPYKLFSSQNHKESLYIPNSSRSKFNWSSFLSWLCPLLTLLSWFWSFLFWSAGLLVSAAVDCLFKKVTSI